MTIFLSPLPAARGAGETAAIRINAAANIDAACLVVFTRTSQLAVNRRSYRPFFSAFYFPRILKEEYVVSTYGVNEKSPPIAICDATDENLLAPTSKGAIMLKRVVLLVIMFVVVPVARSADYTVTVSAGENDRLGAPVSFALPENFPAGDAYLSSQSGQIVPLYISQKHATFIVDNLPAHKSATYKLQAAHRKAPS